MKKFSLIAALALVLCMSMTMISCGSSDNDSDAKKEKKATVYTNENGQTQEELNSDEENFLGKWTSHSPYVEDLYENINLDFKADGTFDANVTGEDFSGTWEKIDGGIRFESVYISGDMYYGEKCKLVIHEDDVQPITLERDE